MNKNPPDEKASAPETRKLKPNAITYRGYRIEQGADGLFGLYGAGREQGRYKTMKAAQDAADTIYDSLPTQPRINTSDHRSHSEKCKGSAE